MNVTRTNNRNQTNENNGQLTTDNRQTTRKDAIMSQYTVQRKEENGGNMNRSKLFNSLLSSVCISVVFATLTLAAILGVAMSASATSLYWDGNSTSANADGGAGTWDTTTSNWDTAPFGGSDTSWINGSNTAVFGGATATAAVGSGGVTAGGLTFNANNYVINAGTNGLNFSPGTNFIHSYIGNNGNTAATITGAVAGAGSNIVLSSGADQRIFQLNLNGLSTNGWTGTTTINAGATMALSQTNQALVDTTGITLNGGNILLTNANNDTEAALDRVSNTAAISSYGTGSILMTNTSATGRVYAETIGSITHNNGQMVIGFTTVQNGTAPSTQTVNIGGLTNNGSTSTVGIASTVSVGMHGNSYIRVSGVSETTTGEIVGPWMTVGGVAGQSDWAVYSNDVVGGYRRIVAKGGIATAENTWTSSSATGHYNASAPAPTTSPVNNKLTADRSINTLRASFAETNSSSAANWNINTGTDTISFTGHALADGDVVHFRIAPSGLTENRPYYVINSVAGTSFQLSLTPGGELLDLTTVQAATSFMSTGINLNGNTLAMNGYITGTTGTAAIGGGSGSTITIPSNTTPGNLYLHGAANIWIDPSIKDNGAGELTLVKSGTNTVTLSGANTYTGGTVINAGAITFFNSDSWVSGQDITFGGAGRINASVGALSGDVLNVNQGAVGYITGTSNVTFSTTTGAGKVTYGGNGSTLALGNASGFTGDLQVSNAIGNNSTITFSSIGDTAGSSIQYGGGSTSTTDTATIAYNGSSALTLSNRQVQLLPRSTQNNVPQTNVLRNDSANAAHKLVIEQDLLNTSDRATTLQFNGSNEGNNEFAGDIGNSTYSNVASPTQQALSVVKDGPGKWILSGTNTYTGGTTVNAGTLVFRNTGAKSASGTHAFAAGTTLGLGVGGAGYFDSAAITSAFGSGTILTNVTVTATTNVAVDTTAGDFIHSADITGSPNKSLTKLGANTLTLSGDNTYTGKTTVTEGTVLIDGTTSGQGSYTVQSGAALGGNGEIGLAGGESITFEAGSLFYFSEAATLEVSGNNVSVNLRSLSIDDILNLSETTPLNTYTLIQEVGLGTVNFVYPTANWGIENSQLLGGKTYAYFATDSLNLVDRLDLVVYQIPEPSTAILAGLGIAGMCLRRRRRK